MANNVMVDGTISLDDRPAQEAIKRTNTALDGHEQKTRTVLDRTGREWEVYGDAVVRVSERSKTSLDRLLRSMEQQAELIGKSGVDREIAQRDQLLRRWQNEQQAVDAINKLYERRIALARAAESADSGVAGGATGTGFNARYAFFGIKDLMEGRTKFAIAEAANELMRLRGAALMLGGVAAGIAAIGFAAYETYKDLKEMAEQPRKIAVAFQDLNGAVEANSDQLRAENDRLANTIAKLEHKPQNLLAEALDDARLAADKLAEALDKDVAKVAELIKANHVGWFDRNIMGVAGTGDIEKWYDSYQYATKQVNFAGRENVRRATTKEGAERAQAQWNRTIAALQHSAETKLEGWMGDAQKPRIAGQGTIFAQDDHPEARAARLALIQGMLGNLRTEGDVATLMEQQPKLKARAQALQAAKETPFGELGGKPITFDEFLHKFSATLDKQVESQKNATSEDVHRCHEARSHEPVGAGPPRVGVR